MQLTDEELKQHLLERLKKRLTVIEQVIDFSKSKPNNFLNDKEETKP